MSNAENIDRRHFLRTAAMTVGATGFGTITSAYAQNRNTKAAAQLPAEGQMPSFGRATEWLNSKPLTPGDLRGKIVLINFCGHIPVSTGAANSLTFALGRKNTAIKDCS